MTLQARPRGPLPLLSVRKEAGVPLLVRAAVGGLRPRRARVTLQTGLPSVGGQGVVRHSGEDSGEGCVRGIWGHTEKNILRPTRLWYRTHVSESGVVRGGQSRIVGD